MWAIRKTLSLSKAALISAQTYMVVTHLVVVTSRGYVNESIARIAGQGGFWHVTEHIMKRPTVNPTSFKNKFKVNNYGNNEEALWTLMMVCLLRW